MSRPRDIVEPHDRKITPYGQAYLLGGANRSQGHQVVSAQDGSRGVFESQQLLGDAVARLLGQVSLQVEFYWQ